MSTKTQGDIDWLKPVILINSYLISGFPEIVLLRRRINLLYAKSRQAGNSLEVLLFKQWELLTWLKSSTE